MCVLPSSYFYPPPFSQQNAFLKVAADSHHLIIPGDLFSVLYCSLTDRYLYILFQPSSTTTCLTCLLLNARVPNEAPRECSESIPEDRPVRFLLFLKTCWNGLSAAYHMAHPPRMTNTHTNTAKQRISHLHLCRTFCSSTRLHIKEMNILYVGTQRHTHNHRNLKEGTEEIHPQDPSLKHPLSSILWQ